MKTKDYVYLDNELLNSHLAQFEKGLLTKETTEHGTESSDTINGWSNTASGLNGILGIGVKFQYDVHEGDSTVESEFTKNIVENVLNDYAVDLLIEDCDKNNLLHNLCQSNEGDFTLFSSEFKIYDKAMTNEDVQLSDPAYQREFEAQVREELTVDKILGKNTSKDEIKYNLSLPENINGVSVTWKSGNTDVITDDGIVKCKDTEQNVTMTGTAKSGALKAEISFDLKVMLLDRTALDAALAELKRFGS